MENPMIEPADPIIAVTGLKVRFSGKLVLDEVNLSLWAGQIAVSHSLSETRRLADRVCVLREGRIVQELDREHLKDPVAFHRLVDAAF
jgi:ABC-type transporter Mla maintaining outer membrane lipid asymmetry ATPase subunit MlaF